MNINTAYSEFQCFRGLLCVFYADCTEVNQCLCSDNKRCYIINPSWFTDDIRRFNIIKLGLYIVYARKTIGTRSSAIAERPARRSMSVEMLPFCCTNNRLRVSLRSTFSNMPRLFRYLHSLYTHRCSRLNYRTCNVEVSHSCDQQTSTTTNVTVGVNWTVAVINNVRPPPTLLITPHIPAPAHRRER